MEKLLKRIADFILIFVAILGIINFLPIKIKETDILILSGAILFIILIILIITHVSKLEERINRIEEKFITEKDLNKIRTDIKAFKLSKLTKNE